MKRSRILPLVGLLFLAVAIWGFQRAITSWMVGRLKQQLPIPLTFQTVHFQWPLGINVKGVTIPNPPQAPGGAPYFLKVKELNLQIPFLGLLNQPIPVRASVHAPHMILDFSNVFLLGPIDVEKGLWMKPPSPRGGGPFALASFQVSEGRVDYFEKSVRPDAPFFTLSDLTISLEVLAPKGELILKETSHGRFVSATGDPIGEAFSQTLFEPTRGRTVGLLRFRHERLEEFRRIYAISPQPIFIEGGTGEITFRWRFEGLKVRVEFESDLRRLHLTGRVEDLSWERIVENLQDPQGRIHLSAVAEGHLDDPTFNVHDRILSDLDWTIKERLAFKGIRVPGRLFFGLNKPEPDFSRRTDPLSAEAS